MHEMTKKNMLDAFAGESMARNKYDNFARIAEKEGFPNVARMFKAIAYAEFVHASNHMGVLGYKKTTSENLLEAAGGENFEVNEMYPAYNEVAKLQNEKEAKLSIHYAIEAEKIHEKMYLDAKNIVDGGKDIELGAVYICDKCGYTCEGEAPDKCPVCQAAKERFVEFK
ncbi:MAG: rubrerythrin family protein [Firmicutes bacterium]|nr:rubrerythrin family protein [Bacillota bacterium]